MDQLAHRQPAVPSVLVYIFVFQNVLNPGSPYLTLAINTGLAFFALLLSHFRFRSNDRQLFLISIILLAWLLLVAVYRGDAETQTILKYVRTALTIGLVTIFIGATRIESSSLLNAISLTLGFHVVLVMLQIPFEGLVQITAPFFGFDRELTILGQYNLRKLGASSSYDTASFFSVCSAVLFYLRYHSSRKFIFLLLLGVSLAAGMMSSRAGMAMSAAVLMYLYIKGIYVARPTIKLVLGFGLLGFLGFFYLFIYPLALHTLGIRELSADEASFLFAAADYGTTGTLEALSDDHLAPLSVAPWDLIIGFALDPNSIGKSSDIGYVKFIYHVGIVGTTAILLLHARILSVTLRDLQSPNLDTSLRIIALFLIWLVGAGLFFNYKSLELYSRGTGDLIFILFMYLGSHWAEARIHRGAPSA
jgi:hypothetical protein